MNNPNTRNWRFAFVLCLPVLLFFGAYLFNHSNSLTPTGFTQYDNAAYIAYAKQYLDADSFNLLYSNPFNDHAAAPIYFQPQTIFFAILLKFGIPPGWILIPFCILCALVCFRLVIALYDSLASPGGHRTFHIWLLAWGGGILCLAGVVAHLALHKQSSIVDDLFLLDPEHGWWGLNLGRSLFFSCEAYYHALFLGSIYFLIKRKWLATSLLTLVLVMSHPFTGIELLSIVFAWLLLETLINRRSIPIWVIALHAAYLVLYFAYYLFYLNRFDEHRSVAGQYALDWRLGYYRIIPAYGFVAILAIVAISMKKFQPFFQSRANRLLGCWFVVAFLLANHEWFIQPRQPIHFTRGYVWASLFLLGLPALQQFSSYLKRNFARTVLVIFAALFFLDNFCWLTLRCASKGVAAGSSYLNGEQLQILKMLNDHATAQTMLISDDGTISYLSTVYTKAYPWFSHPYTTPFAAKKKASLNSFLQEGHIDTSWLGRNIVIVLHKDLQTENLKLLIRNTNLKKASETDHYLILQTDSLYLQ